MMVEEESDTAYELRRVFPKEQFMTIVEKLLQGLKISANVRLQQIYQKLITEKGAVIGQDIVEIAQDFKDQQSAETTMNSQIEYYQDALSQLKNSGVLTLTTQDFMRFFINENPHRHLISEQILPRIDNIDYISVKKLQRLIHSIQKMKKHKGRSQYPSDLLTLEQSQVYVYDQHKFNKDNILDELSAYARENILDSVVSDNIGNMIEDIRRYVFELKERQFNGIQVQKRLREETEKLQDELFRMEQLIDQKDEQIAEYEEKFTLFKKQYATQQTKVKELTEAVFKLQKEVDSVTKERDAQMANFQELRNRLQWFKNNYQGVCKEYEEFVSKTLETQKSLQKEKQSKLFAQRSIKEQLEDAHLKISRLRSQKNQMSRKIADTQAVYEGQVHDLQLRLKQAEQVLRNVRHSHQFSELASSYLRSRLQTDSVLQRGSLAQSSALSVKPQCRRLDIEESDKSLIVLRQAVQQNMKRDFKKKQNAISAEVQTIFNVQLEQKLNRYDEIGVMKNKQLRALTKLVQEGSQQAPEEATHGILSCSAYLIHDSGNKFPIGVILSSEQFVILDSKMRLNYTVKFSQLRKVLFCYHNQSWLVLKVKENEINQKKHAVADMVISLHNRVELMQYMHENCQQKLRHEKVQVKVQRQENIWIKASGKEILLSNFHNYYNIAKISIENAHNIFEAEVKEVAWLSRSTTVILIVTEIGILAFQHDGASQLQKNQNLLYLLPIVEKMEVIELPNKQNIIKLTYETDKKAYKICLASYALTKKLKRAIQEKRENSVVKKNKETEKWGNDSRLSLK